MKTAALLILISCCLGAVGAQEPAPVRIWSGVAPGSDAKHWPRPDYKEEWEIPEQVLTGVTDPEIQVYLPERSVNTGAAVVICPGGGYRNLWIAKEGWKVARELQKRGIAGIVLKYRHYSQLAAVQDAHRAVRYVRSRASEWHINPEAVGVGGFSAGGHLALNMAAQLGRQENWARDDVDRFPKRPDFIMAIYPAVHLDKTAVVDASLPPVFFASAADDTKTPADDLLRFVLRLQMLKVPAEVHLFQAGGHGFGTGTRECRCAGWVDLFREWMDGRGLLGKR